MRGPRRDETPDSGFAERHAKVKVCLVGANTGCKTDLVRKHVLDAFDDRYIETLGAKVSKKVLNTKTRGSASPVTLDLMIFDILSQRGFRELLMEAYVHGSQGILAVTDMTRRATLQDLDGWIRGVQNVTGPVPVVVLAANRDRKGHLEMTEEEVAEVAKSHGASCFFVSNASEDPVEFAFRELGDTILARFVEAPRRTRRDRER